MERRKCDRCGGSLPGRVVYRRDNWKLVVIETPTATWLELRDGARAPGADPRLCVEPLIGTAFMVPREPDSRGHLRPCGHSERDGNGICRFCGDRAYHARPIESPLQPT